MFLQYIHSRLAPGASFNLLGYSFGGAVAMEVAVALEAQGWEGHLYLVDSSPDFLKAALERYISSNEDQFEINLMCIIFNLVAPHEATPAAVSQVDRKNYSCMRNLKFHDISSFSSNLHTKEEKFIQIYPVISKTLMIRN
jgi:thioesterase domain-containing protein